FQWAGRSNRFSEQLTGGVTPHRAQKLYYSTASFTLTDRQPISPPPVTCVIEIGHLLDKKIAAFQAHTSQSPLFPIFEGTVRKRGKQELFHLAASSNPQTIGKEIETDLFSDVKSE